MALHKLRPHHQPLFEHKWIHDYLSFAREWLRNPKDVAAVIPSSPALAALMAKHIDSNTGPVIELGPGTGSITQALISRGVAEEQLTLIEIGGDFSLRLQQRFPNAKVLQMDATLLQEVDVLDGEKAGAVICSLGLLNMTYHTVRQVLEGAFSHLKPDGAFFLFTYGHQCSVPETVLSHLNLTVTRIGKTYVNLPPATVYRIERSH